LQKGTKIGRNRTGAMPVRQKSDLAGNTDIDPASTRKP
jgi:hypothetical protein